MESPKKSTFDICIILQGCPMDEGSIPPIENVWEKWLEAELIAKGYTAVAPDMPTPWIPVYADWKRAFEKHPISENSILVGHSCGAAFLVRYLLETQKKVQKLILVAPAKIASEGDSTRDDLYGFELPADGSGIAKEIVIFFSDDRPRHMAALELYKQSLHPRLVELPNKGHFLFNYMKTNAFPELLNEILSS